MKRRAQVAAAEVSEVRVDGEWTAGGGNHEVVGVEQAALAVHLPTQPSHEGREFASRKPRGNAGFGGAGGGEKLGGSDRAKRVGREITPAAARPVDVLQAAARIVRHRDAEPLAPPRGAGAGPVGAGAEGVA